MTWEETAAHLRLCLPDAIGRRLSEMSFVRELRIRANRPVALYADGECVLADVVPTAQQVAAIAESLCEHALYARAEEAKQGYVTLRGGHRMGLCGRVLMQDGLPIALREVSSLCVRVACEWPGAADALWPYLLDSRGHATSLLVIGLPGTGKTTILRDACRRLGNAGKRVCVADERGELAASYRGAPQLDVGAGTDVLDGCPKPQAMRWLLRSMSPEIVVTDELATPEDALAAREMMDNGVPVLASAHGRNVERLGGAVGELARSGSFTRVAILTAGDVGCVETVHDALARHCTEGATCWG